MNCTRDGGGVLLERVKTTMFRLLKNPLLTLFILEPAAIKIIWLRERDQKFLQAGLLPTTAL